jgi:hypothetical protein
LNQNSGRKQPFPTCKCIKQVFFNFNLRKYKGLVVKFEPLTGLEGLLSLSLRPLLLNKTQLEKNNPHSSRYSKHNFRKITFDD